MAHQLYHQASLQTKKTEPSLLASVRSNGDWLPHAAKNAVSITFQVSKRRIPHSIVCSANGTPTVTTADPRTKRTSVGLGRSSFPPGFAFGTASAAYQVEGAWNEGGRGPSIWDTFTHEHSGKIKDKTNGDKATDSYNRYKEDIQLMKQMGVDSYRFSISWSRILPDGTKKGGVNRDGVMYYNNLINELIKNGITPYVTLFHWDVPQALEKEYGGFRSRKIVQDFEDYTKVCFQQFGDRVKHWITLNEPWTFSSCGYSLGRHAPGRCSEYLKDFECPVVGDSLTEPYIVTHNLILAHAAAARLYKDHFKALQRGEVGITLVSLWFDPYSESYEDKAAAERSMDFMLGWYMDPLVNGDYPVIMRAIVRDRLPYFTKEESEMIKGSYDFIGINYYTSRYAKASHATPVLSVTEAYADQIKEKDGFPIGKLQGSWIHLVPTGMKNLLVYMKKRYNNPKIYITENGTAQLDDNLSMEKACDDKDRIDYMSLHLEKVREAIQEGVDVKGYFAWSLTDNFEWDEGYRERFGLIYIDYAKNFERHPKASSAWYTRFLKS